MSTPEKNMANEIKKLTDELFHEYKKSSGRYGKVYTPHLWMFVWDLEHGVVPREIVEKYLSKLPRPIGDKYLGLVHPYRRVLAAIDECDKKYYDGLLNTNVNGKLSILLHVSH